MKGSQTKVVPILGMDQSLFPKTGFMGVLANVRCNADGSWSNDVGWEPLLNTLSGSTFAYPSATAASLFAPTRFLKHWKSNEGVPYYLYERDGSLQYDWGNIGSAASRTIVLGTDRNIPTPDDCGTQLIDCKGFCILLNGIDKPIKFWGRSRVEQFSWTERPASPTILAPQPEAIEPAPTAVSIEPTKATIKFSKGGELGLGDSDNGSINTYGYRVAFLSNSGSVSPMSEMTLVNWSIDNTNQEGRYGIVLVAIPTGPQGTVARIIYRTKNMRDGIEPTLATVYEAFRINENVTTQAIDTCPDSRLSLAPTDILGSNTISTEFKYGAMFDNRVWLAYDNTIIYSEQNLYEQFPVFNYLETGNGSPITALVPYYNSLIVFREKSIDVISRASSGATANYTVSVLDSSVGTTATNSIQAVPGVGIVFLAQDGVRSISGGLQGGSTVRNTELAKQLSKEWERLSRGSLARACSSVSLRDNEYWVHYPADGSFENTRGAVLHFVNGGWSLRNNDYTSSTDGPMRFTCMTVDDAGYTILGTAPTGTGSVSTWKSYPGIGLQVWSHAPYAGRKLTYSSTGVSNYNWTVADNEKIISAIISSEMDLGSLDVLKTIVHVVLEGKTQGNNTAPMKWYLDYSYKGTSTKSIPMQSSAHYNTKDAQAMFYPVPATNDKPVAVWGTSVWEESRRFVARYEIAATKASTFRYELVTSNSWCFYGWYLSYTVDGTNNIYHYG